MSMIYREGVRMSNNIFTVFGEVPELGEKKTKAIVNDYLGQEIDDFKYVKYNCMRVT